MHLFFNTFMTKSNGFVHFNKSIRFSHKCCPKTRVMSGEQMAPHKGLEENYIRKALSIQPGLYQASSNAEKIWMKSYLIGLQFNKTPQKFHNVPILQLLLM